MTEILGEHCLQQIQIPEVAEWLWVSGGGKLRGAVSENSYLLSSYWLVFCLFVFVFLLYTARWICLRINYSKYLFFKKFYWDVIRMLYSSPFSNTTQWFPIYYNIFKNCGNETVYLRWGLEPMFWDLNPCGWDSNLCSSNWDCRPGFRTKWSSGSWCFISERIQWETKWQVRSGFIQRETSSTDRVWAIREGEWGLKMWHG